MEVFTVHLDAPMDRAVRPIKRIVRRKVLKTGLKWFTLSPARAGGDPIKVLKEDVFTSEEEARRALDRRVARLADDLRAYVKELEETKAQTEVGPDCEAAEAKRPEGAEKPEDKPNQ